MRRVQPGRPRWPGPWAWVLAGAAVLAALGIQTGRYDHPPALLEAVLNGPGRVLTGAAEVIDGDSLRIGGVEIRLSGIDAPEYRQNCEEGGRQVACGQRARAALASLVAAGQLDCRLSGNDRYGRALARCTAGQIDVNEEMVLRGQAVAYGDYQLAEARARWAGRGLWAGRFVPPQDWRRTHAR